MVIHFSFITEVLLGTFSEREPYPFKDPARGTSEEPLSKRRITLNSKKEKGFLRVFDSVAGFYIRYNLSGFSLFH